MITRSIQGLLCLLSLLLVVNPAGAKEKDLFVDVSTHSMWIAVTGNGDNNTSQQSSIFSRAMGTDQWQQLYQIASPLVSLTHQEGQPAILLSNGQWMFVYQDGRSLGADVPADGRLVQLASNGSTICGVAWVDGGLSSLTASTRPLSPAGPARLVLMAFQRGQWQGLTEIPGVPPNAKVSLGGNNGNLLIAWLASDKQLDISQWSAGNGLQNLLPIVTPFKISECKALYAGDMPLIWIAPETGLGSVYKWNHEWTAVALASSSGLAQAQSRDLGVDSDQQLRLVYNTTDALYQQNFDLHGAAVGKPVLILAQQEEPDNSSDHWVTIAIIAVVVFLLLKAAFRRQQVIAQQSDGGPAIVLAPLLRRAGAGIVDFIPYLITAAIHMPTINPPITTYEQFVRTMDLPSVRFCAIVAMSVYILFTTVGEIFLPDPWGNLFSG